MNCNYRSMPQVFPRLATKPAVITHKWKAYAGAKYKWIWKTWKKQHTILQFLQAFKSRRCVWTWKRSSLYLFILASSIESKKRRKKERKKNSHAAPSDSIPHSSPVPNGLETFIKSQDPGYFSTLSQGRKIWTTQPRCKVSQSSPQHWH